jgi:hypothetical protein
MSVRGINAMISKPAEEVEGVFAEKFQEVLSDAGGWEGWGKLPTEDQLQWLEHLVEAVRHHFGELDFAELPELERRIEVLFLWSGCAMHKDLNTFKAGAASLVKFWKEDGLDGPVKLLSREQERGVLTDKDEGEDDVDNAVGGAVKLTSLIGALVNNKLETKGCSEEFWTYTHDRLGKAITFPDTSNIRYQCYGDAAAEVVQHPDLYVDFINQHGMKKKGGAGPNHMERNILKGLADPPTMTEMAVLALYHESVSKPYAMQVRGLVNEQKNALDLGPLHDDLVDHCDAIVNDPELLIGNNVSHTTGAFYSTPWDQSVVDHILSTRDQLPHLRGALVAFFKGAYEKWPAFTDEFGPGSEISQTTAEERALAFRSPTNDHNEGACAMVKHWSRRAPTMTTHQKNARMQVQLNGSSLLEFSHSLGEEDRAFTRRRARELDAAKLPLKERQAQAVADREAVEEEQREVERRTRRKEERKAEESGMLEGFQPILDLDQFRSLPATQPKNDLLKKQLVWHRVVDGDRHLPAGLFTSMNKEKMKELIVEALERRDETAADCGIEMELDSEGPKSFQTWVGDRMDTDVALTPDESEAELELVDKVGLTLSDTAGTNRSPPRGYVPTPGPSHLPTSTLPIHHFGCRWDPVDYSCAYDCAFMTFAWIYFYTTEHWRQAWASESPITKILSRHLKTILRTLKDNQSDRAISASFSGGRDAFRDALSAENPAYFKRRGRVYASLIDILDSLSRGQTSSRYFSFITSCGGPDCNLRLTTPAGAPFMLTPYNWSSITRSKNPPYHESLQEWITGYFNEKASLQSHTCPQCGRESSTTRSFLQPPWIWFEVFVEQPHVVLPPFEISLSSETYRLAAVIYGNTHHFVARLSTPSGTWWSYDGQVNGGQPVVDSVTHKAEDLITYGDGYVMNALVYSPTR